MLLNFRNIALFITGLCLCIQSASQNSFDIISLSDLCGLHQSYEIKYMPNLSENASVLNLTFPVFISRNTIWVNSLNHFYNNVSWETNLSESDKNTIGLSGFILRTGIHKMLDRTTRIQLLFSPRLMSDFYSGNIKSLQLGGIFIYEKVIDRSLTTGYGLIYNQELFGPMLSPVLNLNWQIADNWHLKSLFPYTFRLNYKLNKNLTFGFNHFALVSSYYLSNPQFNRDYIERQCIDWSLFARYRLLGSFYIEGKAGRTFGRSYQQFAGDQKTSFSIPFVHFGDNRTAIKAEKKNDFFLSGSIVYIIDYPKHW